MEVREFLQRRLEMGEGRADIARKIGVHPSYVTRWLAGQVPDPRACRQIADSFGLPHRTVLEMAGHYEGEKASDPELDVWLREVAEIYASFDRSRWADLTATFRGLSSLVSSPAHGSPSTPARSSRERGHHIDQDGRDSEHGSRQSPAPTPLEALRRFFLEPSTPQRALVPMAAY